MNRITINRAQTRQMQRDMSRLASGKPRPKHIDPAAALRAVQRCSPAVSDDVLQGKVAVREALERLRSAPGHSQQAANDYATLACMANVSLVRAEAISPLLVPPVQAAQDALVRMQARAARGLGYGFDGTGLQAVTDVVDVFEQILDLSTPAQMHAANAQVLARMRKGVVLEGAP